MKLQFVGNAPFFSELTEEEQERVSERMHLEHRRNGETLFKKGDSSGALYLIKSGWVRLLANGGSVIASQGPGSLVGETDLFHDRTRSLSATMSTDVELWALSREDLIELIAQDPHLGITLSLAFGSRLALFDRYLVDERLKPLPFFANLENDSLVAVARRLVPLEKKEGEFVVESGQPSQALFIVESGQLHLHSSEEGGDFSELGAGESFGEMAVLTAKPHGRTVQAATDVTLWVLPAEEFEALTDEHPNVRLALSKSLREPLLPRDQSRAVERLGVMPLFGDLPEEVLWAVAERLLLLHVPAGETVFAQGALGDAFYIIDSGQVEILSDGQHGRTTLARLGMDEFFGEMALLTGKPRTNGARAANHTNLWVLYRADFDDLVNRYPAISMALSKVLTERLAHLDRRFTENHLRGLKLLAGLTPGQLEDVSRRLKPVRFRQGELVIREGQSGHEMYLMESGRVRVVRGQGADATVLDEMGAGDLFGEMSLLTGKPRSATIIALTDLNLWMISQSDFDELVTAYPNLALALSRLLSERLRNTDDRVLQKPAPAAAAPARRPAPVPRPSPVPRTATTQTVPLRQPAPARQPAPKRQPAPSRRPAPKRQPAPSRRLAPRPRRSGPGVLDGILSWFGELSPRAKLRLLLITMALAWIALIAAPVLVISTLAADNVTNLQGAIAFVQTATPPPAEALPMLAEEAVPVAPAEEQPVHAQMLAAEPQASQVQEAAEAQADAAAAAAAQPLPTETPWIIVITNTPPPPTDTPEPTPTPLPPTATPKPRQVSAAAPAAPQPTATSVERPQPQRKLDGRLSALNVGVEPAGVRPGQSYWRLTEARWANESEAGGGHSIFINVVDEGGNRLVGLPVEIRWESGNLTVMTEDKPINEYAANFPMYNTLGSYAVSVAGLPSDIVVGLGLGSIEQPDFKVHTCFFLTFQRTTR